MILSCLEHARRQLPGIPGLLKALEFLRRPGSASLPDGKYEIDGAHVFAIVQRYDTAAAPEPRFEAHRKYIDMQFVAAGTEIIGWAPLAGMTVSEAYDGETDVCFGAVPPGAWTPARLEAGQLAVFFPEDAHAPRLAAGAAGPVLKIVVKIAV